MEKNIMEKITLRAKDLALSYGASAVGVVTTEMLEGGPPSTDLSYVLPNASSAISFAVSLDQKHIDSWFSKKSHTDHLRNNIQANVVASGISLELANYLIQKGYPSAPLTANTAYRTDSKNGIFDEIPPISHRYLAVRSGVGFFGLSGNVLTPNDGAAIILGSVVTGAKLVPTDPIPAESDYCDDCRLCEAACASGYIDGKQKVTVTLGGIDFSYCQKRHHSRCDFVCGGFAGLHKSGKWSTWSPARFPIPEKDEEFYPALVKAVGPFLKRPRPPVNVFNVLMPGDRVELTCGNCQLICHPDKEIRKKRYKLLAESGVIVEHPDGRREAVSPEAARKHLAAMDPATRVLYENT
jgi:epoxyqueuosine reductase QueG